MSLMYLLLNLFLIFNKRKKKISKKIVMIYLRQILYKKGSKLRISKKARN